MPNSIHIRRSVTRIATRRGAFGGRTRALQARLQNQDKPTTRITPSYSRRARLYQLVERCTSVLPVSSSRDGKSPDSQDGLWPQLLEKWSALPLQQKGTVAVAGVAGGIVAWKVLTIALVLLERVLVGSLIALEEVLVSSIIRGVSLVFVLGTVALVAYATYYLVIGTEDRWK